MDDEPGDFTPGALTGVSRRCRLRERSPTRAALVGITGRGGGYVPPDVGAAVERRDEAEEAGSP